MWGGGGLSPSKIRKNRHFPPPNPITNIKISCSFCIPDNLVLKVETILQPGEDGIQSDKQSWGNRFYWHYIKHIIKGDYTRMRSGDVKQLSVFIKILIGI